MVSLTVGSVLFFVDPFNIYTRLESGGWWFDWFHDRLFLLTISRRAVVTNAFISYVLGLYESMKDYRYRLENLQKEVFLSDVEASHRCCFDIFYLLCFAPGAKSHSL